MFVILLMLQTALPAGTVGGEAPRRFVQPSGTPAACVVKQPPGPWVSNDDYPAVARRKQMQGTVKFTLEISELGCPVACTVDVSSGWELLDTHTCQLMLKRARFKPGKDPMGLPKGGMWTGRFNWSLN